MGTPAPVCGCTRSVALWNRCDLLSCLAGKKVGVVGDSLGRQLFTRFVSLLRQGPGGPVVDAYFNAGAEFWAEEDADCLTLGVGTEWAKANKCKPPRDPQKAFVL